MDVLDLVAEQIAGEMAGVLAIHDLNLAIRYCDSLALLCESKIVGAGPPEILTCDLISDVYDVKATVTEYQGRPFVVPKRPLYRGSLL